MKNQKAKKSRIVDQLLLAAFVVGVAFSGGQAFAQTASAPVDDLQTETTKISGIYDTIKGPAIGSGVFGIAMVIIKRLAFS